jgi:hypothetical protein
MFHQAPQFADSDFQETLILSVLRRLQPTLVMAFRQPAERADFVTG